MKSLKEFDAFWQGALLWSDAQLSDEEKTARTRSYFGIEFHCRSAVLSDCGLIHCISGNTVCVCELCACEMPDCPDFVQMPCNLREIIKAQSSESQAIITQEPGDRCASKATVTPEVIGSVDHEDG